MDLKNIIVYYFAVVIPVAIVFLLAQTNTINSNWFVYTFCFYLFVYRTYSDGKRLADKGLIEKKDIWKMIIPGQRIRFFKDLYLR
jgi:Ca2+/Na+ antiporter